MHYTESSQNVKWQLASCKELNLLRERSNKRARDVLSCETVGGTVDASATNKDTSHAYGFSETFKREKEVDGACLEAADEELMGESDPAYGPSLTSAQRGSNPMLTPAEETSLITFYCSKIPLLIGPHATLPRCKRDAKVSATACLLFRRFYLSNSVMMFDPKAMLAAAAFLASKVEDCTISVKYLELGTQEMSAEVKVSEILEAEVKLITGVDFDLLVFSPYKTVLSYTEDLRTFLKTEKGQKLVAFSADDGGVDRQLDGKDLSPTHDAAMKIVDDAIVSDLPLLFGPGEVGLAALMVGNERVRNRNDDSDSIPQIDFMGYIRLRFQDADAADQEAIDSVTQRISKLVQMIRELDEGRHGCGNHGVDMEQLKGINKRLKKCRIWGQSDKKKKKKKRKAESQE